MYNFNDCFMILWHKLPDVIIQYILEYFKNQHELVLLNKYWYHKNHYLLKYNEILVERMIEKDYSFVFCKIMKENIEKWVKRKKCIYKSNEFNNPIYKFLEISNEKNAFKCRKCILNELENKHLRRNLHKKFVVKCINGKFKY